ncbi:Phosphatidylinositol (PI) 3-kinase, partial [Linderina pennispora]
MNYNNGTSGDQFVDFSFCESKDINEFVSVRIDKLWGTLPGSKRSSQTSRGIAMLEEHFQQIGLDGDIGLDQASEPLLFITAQLWSSDIPQSLPLQTKYKAKAHTDGWNEWVRFPTKYNELAVDACIVVTLWQQEALWKVAHCGTCRIHLFADDSELVQGNQRLQLIPKGHTGLGAEPLEYDRLFAAVRRYEDGDMQRVDWLDTLTMQRIEETETTERRQSGRLYIHVSFPKFDFAVVFGESTLDDPITKLTAQPKYSLVFDPEAYRDNPSETKHRRLLRGYRSGPLDRELKPNAALRDQLNTIVRYAPSQQLTDAEKDLVWKFRFYLATNKKALTKFVKCVDWRDPIESKQATKLLAEWAEIDIDDALELLGAEVTDYAVRVYAVSKLRKANDDELVVYLLQLVQAIRFEYQGAGAAVGPGGDVASSMAGGVEAPGRLQQQQSAANLHESSLADFLLGRALQNTTLGNFFYWYLMVECKDRSMGKIYGKIVFQYVKALSDTQAGANTQSTFERQSKLVGDLARVSGLVQQLKETRTRKVDWLRAYLADPRHGLNSFPALSLPLDPSVQVVGIQADKAS